jgi:tetratricopeptide (TPR) repeat protein
VQTFELLMRGQFDQAIAECRRAVDGDPLLEASSDDDPLLAGAVALSRGNLPGALQPLRAAVEANPGRSEAHRILGVASRLDEQLEQSVAAYTAAIRVRPTDERSRMGLADVLIDMARFPEAEQVLKDTIRLVPATVQAHYRLGRLYQSQGNYPEALKELEYTAQFSPLVGQDPLHEMVALIYATQADFAGATTALRRQIAVNPNNADAHRRLGDAYARLDRTAEALAEFTTAILIDPRNLLSHVGISQIHLRSGNHQDAARAARAAVALDEAQKEARYVLAMSLLRLGQAEQGNRELREFQRLQAEAALEVQRKYEMDGLTREIGVSLGAANYTAAIPLLRQAITREPGVAAHYVNLGAALSKTNQLAEAVEAFQLAVQREPLDPDVHLRLAEAYFAAGRADEGRQAANRYRELIEIAKRQRALRFGNP